MSDNEQVTPPGTPPAEQEVVEIEHEADSEEVVQEDAKAEAEAEVKAEAEVEVKAETEVEVKAETEVEVKAEAEVEVKAEAEVEVKAEAEVEVKAEAEVEVKAEAEVEAKVKAEVEAKVKAEAEVEVKAETEVEVKAEAEVEAEVKAEAEVEVKAEAEAEVEVKAEAEVEVKAEAEVDSEAEAEVDSEAEAEVDSEAEAEDIAPPLGLPPPVPSFAPDFPTDLPPVEEEEDLKQAPYEEEEEDFVVEQVPYVVGKAAAAATEAKAEPEVAPAKASTPADTGDFFIIRRRKKNFVSAPIYSIELYDPEGTPESTYRIYAQITVALKPYFSISGDKEDFTKKREKRSHLFVGKLVVEKAKKVYIGAMQNTEDRTKSHMVSIIYDQKKDEDVVRMEVAITLVPTPTLHDEFMLMRVNQTQNSTRVNELFVLHDHAETDTTLSNIIPMKLKGKVKKVPSNTIFALTKVPSKWGGSEKPTISEKPEGFLFMQFGKIRESTLYPEETMDTYTVQFQDPVTMVTAFMIILSKFDCMK